MLFRMFYDDKLAQASYFIGCQKTGEAIVVDPERDIARYLQFAAREGMKIAAVTETHIHADFLSGSRELAEKTGANLYLSDEGDADWKYGWASKGNAKHHLVKDGDTFSVGNIKFQVLHTPGHTPEHISFLVTDVGGGAGEPMGLLSGDYVFVGDVGRPDLLETAAGQAGAKETSARTLFQTLQGFKDLPDYLQLWPGHGAGSACGKALGAVPQSTVGYEKRFNSSIIAAADEDIFLKSILHGQPEPPLYFARMKKWNKEGPPLLGEWPKPKAVAVSEIAKILAGKVAILDTRDWNTFIEAHVPGALFAPLDTSFPTVAGSYVEADTPIYLVVPAAQVDEAVTALIRIGLDNVAGYIAPEALHEYFRSGGKTASTDMADIKSLLSRDVKSSELILDVRRADEFEDGHLAGAVNIAHTRLAARLKELPKNRHLLVHCRTSNRSAYAAALLQKEGFEVTMMHGGFVAWEAAGGKVEKEPVPVS